ncbi:OsmC family peroxiredoxin [Kibdelosporangium persicum]|uniref:Redox protein, regulator of disulfide bond formation n=1 Tax=Kibdelosporangium persicum TaxID=2698649 RepID=A0ABX2EWB3_9PSEU|nr:OsmC family peroxiredoxin [Kibdelosporangium persicum]NRN63321.1 putative redox protein, regulator of disulfide bond formation [Kibdelosporangium persicum]
MPSRDATTRWEGDLQTGGGTVTLDSSNAGQFPVTFPARTGDPEGMTSPEELIAAAHSSCLAMNFTGTIKKAGYTPGTVDVSAEVTLGPDPEGGFKITEIAITLVAKVEGLDKDKFAELAATAERTCPVTKALAGTTITLDASLAE